MVKKSTTKNCIIAIKRGTKSAILTSGNIFSRRYSEYKSQPLGIVTVTLAELPYRFQHNKDSYFDFINISKLNSAIPPTSEEWVSLPQADFYDK